jgi:hypothetical protein
MSRDIEREPFRNKVAQFSCFTRESFAIGAFGVIRCAEPAGTRFKLVYFALHPTKKAGRVNDLF